MNCDQSQKTMVDALYGEEIDSRSSFEFFSHLAKCETCSEEYEELLSTREKLGEWEVEYPRQATIDLERSTGPGPLTGIPWWQTVQRLAAGVLIVFGALYLLQSLGYFGGKQLLVNEGQLSQTVRDMIVTEQLEERERILEALLRVKEDVELTQRSNLEELQQYVQILERRYVSSVEENSHFLQTLMTK